MNASEWNAAYPIGTPIRLVLADGVSKSTYTAGHARHWGNLDHIEVACMSGYVLLEWVQPLVPPNVA